MFNRKTIKEVFSKPPGAKGFRESAILKTLEIKGILSNEKGAMGIKEIAATVAVIVIIATVTKSVTANSDTWVGQMWTMFTKKIEDLIK